MSSLSYRTWDLWTNAGFFSPTQVHQGYYECTIAGTLMAGNSVRFLAERYNLYVNQVVALDNQTPPQFVQQAVTSEDGQLCVKIYGDLDTAVDLHSTVQKILSLLESMSLAIDGPLTCQRLIFFSSAHGKLLIANRRPIGRGYSFEDDERGRAHAKMTQDLQFYEDLSTPSLVVGRRHYLTGLQLLSLEDQVPGLLDAAFMQFYQGCEALCRDLNGAIIGSQKYIAQQQLEDGRELQIIAHHVWRVRHKYFGHGDVEFNIHSNLSKPNAESVARQVLVARYLCKRLIDVDCPSGIFLAREMGIFFGQYSGNFTGQVNEIETSFRSDFDKREAKVFDASGTEIERYVIA